MLREVKLSDHGWLPIVLCPTDGVDRRLMLPDGREVIGAHHNGGLGQASGWLTKEAFEYDEPVYEEQLRGGFIADFVPRAHRPAPDRKQIGTRKAVMWKVGKLPEGVYPTHFRPNDTVYGRADAKVSPAVAEQTVGEG